MPIIQSAKKRVRTNDKRHNHNVEIKDQMRVAIKNFDSKVREGNKDEAQAACETAYKKLDKAAQKGAIHKNRAARHKSQLAKKLNQLSA